MRKTVLAIGLLLLVAGLFVMNQGVETTYSLADTVGLVSRVPTATTLIAPTLVGVPATNHSELSIDLQGGAEVQGVLTVSGGREIAFYVMNEASFIDWRAGRPSTVIVVKPFTNTYNFSFIVPSTGTYYFVFDNQDTSRAVVVFNLNTISDQIVPNPVLDYLGPELVLIGILFAFIGVRTGKREPKPEPVEVWRCKFCGFKKNPVSEPFCVKCGRSKA